MMRVLGQLAGQAGSAYAATGFGCSHYQRNCRCLCPYLARLRS
jgi:hypothetical protein